MNLKDEEEIRQKFAAIEQMKGRLSEAELAHIERLKAEFEAVKQIMTWHEEGYSVEEMREMTLSGMAEAKKLIDSYRTN